MGTNGLRERRDPGMGCKRGPRRVCVSDVQGQWKWGRVEDEYGG